MCLQVGRESFEIGFEKVGRESLKAVSLRLGLKSGANVGHECGLPFSRISKVGWVASRAFRVQVEVDKITW